MLMITMPLEGSRLIWKVVGQWIKLTSMATVFEGYLPSDSSR